MAGQPECVILITSVFLRCFEETEIVSHFSNGLSIYSIHSLYYHHQNTLRLALRRSRYSDKIVAVSEMYLW